MSFSRPLFALGLCALGALAGCNSSAAKGDGPGVFDAGRNDAGKALLVDGGVAPTVRIPERDAGPADEAIPASTSEELTGRAKHLLEAIAADNADLATDMSFPRDGYVALKDVGDPGKAWEKQIKNPFKKTVHRLNKSKKGVERAQFVSFELGHAVLQSVPRHNEWKKPLWKVRHSKLTFTIDGKVHRIDVAEMTGWRGAWYITRLR